MIPREVLSFVGAQLGVPADALSLMPHGAKPVSSMDTLREIYGYRPSRAVVPVIWRSGLFGREDARSNGILLIVLLCGVGKLPPFCPQYRQSSACARMFVAAERRIETRIAENLTADVRGSPDKLLSEMPPAISVVSSGFANFGLVTTRLLLNRLPRQARISAYPEYQS
ncbi:hypothetical protein [Klebsiella quasipneumoniae]